MPGMALALTFTRSLYEALTLLFSGGIGDTSTSSLCFGTKPKLGFLPCPGHSIVLYKLTMGSGGVNRWWCWAVLSGRLHGWGANCIPLNRRQSQLPCSQWAALGFAGAWATNFFYWLWCFMTLEWGATGCKVEPSRLGLQGWACEGEESGTIPGGKKAGRYQAFGVVRFGVKEMAAKGWEEKWLESVKAVDRGGRGWVVGRGEACFKMTGTIWFMLTHSSSQFGRSANKLGHLMKALLRETWKNGWV